MLSWLNAGGAASSLILTAYCAARQGATGGNGGKGCRGGAPAQAERGAACRSQQRLATVGLGREGNCAAADNLRLCYLHHCTSRLLHARAAADLVWLQRRLTPHSAGSGECKR